MDALTQEGMIEHNTIYVRQINEVKFVPIIVLGMHCPEIEKIYQSIQDGTMDGLSSSDAVIYIDGIRLTHHNVDDYQLLREISKCTH